MRLLKFECTDSDLAFVMAAPDDYDTAGIIDGLTSGWLQMWGLDETLAPGFYLAFDAPLPSEFDLPEYLPFFGKDPEADAKHNPDGSWSARPPEDED